MRAGIPGRCSQMAHKSRCGVLWKAPFTSRHVMMRPNGSMCTTASCKKIGSSGERPAIAPHLFGETTRYIAGPLRLRMSIQMSFASMVAHTMGLELSVIAQPPFLYSGGTRFAQSGGMSVFPKAMSKTRAVRCSSG